MLSSPFPVVWQTTLSESPAIHCKITPVQLIVITTTVLIYFRDMQIIYYIIPTSGRAIINTLPFHIIYSTKTVDLMYFLFYINNSQDISFLHVLRNIAFSVQLQCVWYMIFKQLKYMNKQWRRNATEDRQLQTRKKLESKLRSCFGLLFEHKAE